MNNNTTDTPAAVQNEFNTYMTLREKGVDKDTAQRAADHVRRATNEGGDKGATSAAVQVLRWLGLFALIVVLLIGYANYASANTIYMPTVSSDCRYRCSSSIPMPTATSTPDIGEPPALPTPTMEVQ